MIDKRYHYLNKSIDRLDENRKFLKIWTSLLLVVIAMMLMLYIIVCDNVVNNIDLNHSFWRKA